MNYLLTLSIFDPLYQGFGWLLKMLYIWLQNYGLVIIVFNLAIKIILMPINLNMQRNMARQRFLQDDIAELERVYGQDPQKLNEAKMTLMKNAGVSMTGGCLPQIFQFVVLIALWQPIRSPLQYIGGVSQEALGNITQLLVDQGVLAEQALKTYTASDVNILSALRKFPTALAECVDKGWITLQQVLDLKFLGMDLGKTPSINPGLLFGEDTRAIYLPLLILVLVMIVTMWISMQMTKLNMPTTSGKSKEELRRDKNNPAKAAQGDSRESCAPKVMNWTMPIMMLWMAFTLPAAMALFWLTSNLIAILQAYLSYIYYTKPAQQMLETRKSEKQIPKRRNVKSE